MRNRTPPTPHPSLLLPIVSQAEITFLVYSCGNFARLECVANGNLTLFSMVTLQCYHGSQSSAVMFLHIFPVKLVMGSQVFGSLSFWFDKPCHLCVALVCVFSFASQPYVWQRQASFHIGSASQISEAEWLVIGYVLFTQPLRTACVNRSSSCGVQARMNVDKRRSLCITPHLSVLTFKPVCPFQGRKGVAQPIAHLQ